MRGAKQIVQEAESLPIEERVAVVNSLLQSINPPDPQIDREWIAVAKRRLAELRSGQTIPVPGEKVFAKIKSRFTT